MKKRIPLDKEIPNYFHIPDTEARICKRGLRQWFKYPHLRRLKSLSFVLSTKKPEGDLYYELVKDPDPYEIPSLRWKLTGSIYGYNVVPWTLGVGELLLEYLQDHQRAYVELEYEENV